MGSTSPPLVDSRRRPRIVEEEKKRDPIIGCNHVDVCDVVPIKQQQNGLGHLTRHQLEQS